MRGRPLSAIPVQGFAMTLEDLAESLTTSAQRDDRRGLVGQNQIALTEHLAVSDDRKPATSAWQVPSHGMDARRHAPCQQLGGSMRRYLAAIAPQGATGQRDHADRLTSTAGMDPMTCGQRTRLVTRLEMQIIAQDGVPLQSAHEGEFGLVSGYRNHFHGASR